MADTTWKIDPAHTDVLVAVKHMMVTTVRGKFHAVDGTITLDPEHPERSGGTFSVEVASLATGVQQRDDHLRSPDFFDVASYPTAEFRTTRVEAAGGDRYRVTGDLTIRGTTRPVTFDVELLGFYSAMDGGRRAGIRATATIDREDFGLTWNVALEGGGWLVGKEVRLELDLAVEETAADQQVAAAA